MSRETDFRPSPPFEQPCNLGQCSSLVFFLTCKSRRLELLHFGEVPKRRLGWSGLYFRIHLPATLRPSKWGELARGR